VQSTTFKLVNWRCTKLAKILVASGWPYVNYTPHLGTLIGSILSADVVARYYRLKGEEVLYVTGSDEHGTPVEVEAVRRNISPKQLADENHKSVVNLFERWGIRFDNYTRTESPVHKEFVQKTYLKIYENGYIFAEEDELPYCSNCERFLPDRFIEGTCPFCDYKNARGDQCEQCGRLLEPTELIDPHCAICKTKPILKKSKHWYFDLPKFADPLRRFIDTNERLPENARNFSLNMIKEGLKPRAVTRDNKWGIPAPFPGAENKTIYVWVEAVLGYVSATIEYFKNLGEEERWKEYWFNKDAKTLYFIGKDNISFHTIILPALLLATKEGYNLPWNVSSTEFLQFQGLKFSKSQRVGIMIDEALQLFPADYWRYYLLASRPETKDANFSWDQFKEKINADLNDTLGNFIHRTLTFINQHYNNKVPDPVKLDAEDKRFLKTIKKRITTASRHLEECKLQKALKGILSISRLGNQYLNDKEPWKLLEKDPEKAASVLYVAVQVVKALTVTLEPFIPFTTEDLRTLLNLSNDSDTPSWDEATKPLEPGHRINKAKPLFNKIDAKEEELQENLEKIRMSEQKVSFEEFSKLDLRVGKITKVEDVPKSTNLMKLLIDIGEGEVKQAVAGIAKYYEPKQLEGKHVVVIANLEPRRLFGLESQVMILAAQDGEVVSVLKPDHVVKAGSKIK
jgi:methionyl-tRNA synthetase